MVAIRSIGHWRNLFGERRVASTRVSLLLKPELLADINTIAGKRIFPSTDPLWHSGEPSVDSLSSADLRKFNPVPPPPK